MQQYRLPSRNLATAFVVVQTVVTGGVLLIYSFADWAKTIEILIKVFGANAVTYGVWEMFRQYMWRWPIFRALGLVDVPDLSGEWRGTLNWVGRLSNIPSEYTIRQTYNSIQVFHRGVMSVSHAMSANFLVSGPEKDFPEYILLVSYQNVRNKELSLAELEAKGLKPHISHRGTIALQYASQPEETLQGAIWTEVQSVSPGEVHETHGYVSLVRDKTAKRSKRKGVK